MNFVKRAGFSLWSRRGRTLITLCTFLVISVMVLAGVLIADATAQAKNEAKRSVGAEVNMVMDLGGQNAAGGLVAPQINARTVEKLGASTPVQKYNYSMFDRGVVKGGTELVTGGTDTAASGMGPNGTATVGVLDSALLPDFRSGKFQLLSGAHLTAADKDKRLLLIEERLARKNDLKTGDKITLGANEGTAKAEFTVAGIYRDPRPSSNPSPSTSSTRPTCCTPPSAASPDSTPPRTGPSRSRKRRSSSRTPKTCRSSRRRPSGSRGPSSTGSNWTRTTRRSGR